MCIKPHPDATSPLVSVRKRFANRSKLHRRWWLKSDKQVYGYLPVSYIQK